MKIVDPLYWVKGTDYNRTKILDKNNVTNIALYTHTTKD